MLNVSCPVCSEKMELPECRKCGNVVERRGGIWQLTDMPDIVVADGADKYVGYEHIGEGYSGGRKYMMEDRDRAFAEVVSRLTGGGIFLDLACGDGCFTVPCAALGTRIIAGDISNEMLSILQKKAEMTGVSLDKVMLCRMNAYTIPLANESVDTVVANSVLHLVSNPEKVVREIHRVLKPGGCFICKDDRPGQAAASSYDNSLYMEIVNWLYQAYWETLQAKGIQPVKYGWRFDREEVCGRLFSEAQEEIIIRGNKAETLLGDGFLPRLLARGFSDQVNVPQDLHNEVMIGLLEKAKAQYGGDFAAVPHISDEEDIAVTCYIK